MKDINDLKILVLTVDCWSKDTGANTMSTLFSWCKPENLANIYIRTEIPTYEGCGAYFQIHEKKVIKSIFDRKVITGSRVYITDYESGKDTGKNKLYKLRARRPWLGLYAREFMWILGKWKSAELNDFLDDFKPDLIVFAYEGLIHFNRIVRYSIGYTGAKAIGYFWDDNFTYKQMPGNIGYCIYRFFQRKDIKKSVKLSSANFAITPMTKKECDAFFDINSVLLTKPIKEHQDFQRSNSKIQKPIKMLYTGNLGIGRLNTLKVVAQEIAKVNANANGQRIVLDVYSSTDIPFEVFDEYKNAVYFHEAVSQDLLPEIQKKADVLLFVEDIVGYNKKIARLSFSTKLTDYLAAGKCIFAIADSDIAPIVYLRENNAAVCASNCNEIKACLNTMINDTSVILEYGRRAMELGKRNHDSRRVIDALQCTIKRVIE